MTDGIFIDVDKGPLGYTKYGMTVYLRVGGNKYSLETAYTTDGCKELVDKWQGYAKTLNLFCELSDGAKKYVAG